MNLAQYQKIIKVPNEQSLLQIHDGWNKPLYPAYISCNMFHFSQVDFYTQSCIDKVYTVQYILQESYMHDE